MSGHPLSSPQGEPIAGPGFCNDSSTPTSVYVHIPFCAQRCGYCNFALVADRDYLIDRFLDCLKVEIEMTLANMQLARCPIDTLYFGGGTPSHLSCEQIVRLFDIVLSRFKLEDGAEVSMEVNPNDLDNAKSNTLQNVGVNRVSFGGQSFDSKKLGQLERTHTASDIHKAVELARNSGASVSLDLIFGVAGETEYSWRDDLEQAASLPLDHISTYSLTIEKGTTFGSRLQKGESIGAGEDQTARLYELAIEVLESYDYSQYEISSFARATFECRHNQAYWRLNPYYAFGPGAASFDGQNRRSNHPGLMAYLKKIERGESPVHFSESLEPESLARDRLIFGLRQISGIDIDQFQQQTGFSPSQLVGEIVLQQLVDRGLIEKENRRLLLTRSGILLSDSIAVELL